MLHRGPFKQYDVRGLAPILLRLKEGCVQWHLLNPGGGVSDPVQFKVVHFQTITNIIPHGRRAWKESLAASGFSRTLQLQREIPASSHCCETLQGLLDSTQWEWQYSHSKPKALWDMFLLCVFFFFCRGPFCSLMVLICCSVEMKEEFALKSICGRNPRKSKVSLRPTLAEFSETHFQRPPTGSGFRHTGINDWKLDMGAGSRRLQLCNLNICLDCNCKKKLLSVALKTHWK